MYRINYFILFNFLFLSLFFCACTSYPEASENALRQAGNNRKELEKVLKHYSRSPADSLKFRAAEFLIANMPGKYSEYMDGQWSDIATVYLRWTSSSNKQMVLDTYGLDETVRKDDVTHITAEYLINNIDLAFKVWQEMPWGKHVPFDVFCEEILPYRVSSEPLENWRNKVLASFADIYNSFRNDTTITSVEACRRVNDLLPRFRMDKDFPPMSYSQLMATTRSTCDGMAALGIFVMRGLGIPVTLEMTPMWHDYPWGHTWNSVRDNSGVYISFMGAETNPGNSHIGLTLRKSKVYRQVFANQHHIASDFPPLLQNMNYIKDVTSEYILNFNMRLPVINSHLNHTGNVFLAVPNNMDWYPVAWGKIDDDHLHFQSAGRNILYLPVYYHNGVLSSASYPVFTGYFGWRSFKPYSSRTVSLTSVAPVNTEWNPGMKGGKFEVANQSDFSDARTIHIIETIYKLYYHTVSIKLQSAYRYIRYVSPADRSSNVSELEFYDINNEKLQGSVIGTSGTKENVFDDDVDTYFVSEANPSWVGLDMGEPRKIANIRYLPRTDGNAIYEGHVYELFYWDENKWRSLGQKTANSHVLKYEAPSNALFYLKNITKNRMYRLPFIIESGMQKWL